jgi:hypothetical protein
MLEKKMLEMFFSTIFFSSRSSCFRGTNGAVHLLERAVGPLGMKPDVDGFGFRDNAVRYRLVTRFPIGVATSLAYSHW